MFAKFAAALALALPVLASPSVGRRPIHEIKRSGTGSAKLDSYIVLLKESADKASHLSTLGANFRTSSASVSEVTYTYDNSIHGYAGIFTGAALDALLSDPEIASIQEDGIVSLDFKPGTPRTRMTGAVPPSIRPRQGAGVTVYGIDTGIYLEHHEFGGRARWGATFGGYNDADRNGHGTHTAALAVGETYGVATAASVVAVKVLSDKGRGSTSDIIAGIDYVAGVATGPSIATISIRSDPSDAVDQAVQNLIDRGIHVTVSAGNAESDASTQSPARLVTANTIGAVDSSNQIADFSNFGPLVDVFALGVNVTSAWVFDGPDDSYTLSGTSQSTPHVAGIIAVEIEKYGNLSPAEISQALKDHGAPVVTGEPSDTTNLLAVQW